MSTDQPSGPDQTTPPPPLPTSNVQPVAPPIPYTPPPPAVYGQPQAYPWRLPKSKTTAILLAIFLGFVTWMYTYEKDAWKFWMALAVTVADIVLSGLTLGIWLFVAIPVGLGVWIWGIIDVAAKPQQFYDLYPAA